MRKSMEIYATLRKSWRNIEDPRESMKIAGDSSESEENSKNQRKSKEIDENV